jgi:hypothetical protein
MVAMTRMLLKKMMKQTIQQQPMKNQLMKLEEKKTWEMIMVTESTLRM